MDSSTSGGVVADLRHGTEISVQPKNGMGFRKLALSRSGVVVATAVLIGLAVTGAAFVKFRELEAARLQERFERDAGYRIVSLNQKLDEAVLITRSFGNLIAVDDPPRAESLALYARPLVSERPEVALMAWLPAVSIAERAAFERAISADFGRPIRIHDATPDRSRPAAGSRPVYFPIRHFEPVTPLTDTVAGLDMASSSVRAAMLAQARDTGRLAGTPPLALAGTGRIGVTAAIPIYHRNASLDTVEQRRTALRGFAMVAFRIEDVIASAFSGNGLGGLGLSVNDVAAPVGSQRIFELPQAAGEAPMPWWALRPPKELVSHYRFADRDWEIRLSAGNEYLRANQSANPWLPLQVGGVLTLLLGLYLHMLLLQKGRLETLVAQRTRSLAAESERTKESEERYRSLLDRAPEAILVFDVDLNAWTAANPKAVQLTGYSSEELQHLPFERLYADEQPDARPWMETMHSNIERALAGEEVVFERAIVHRDGRRLICELRLVRLPDGEHRRLRASFVDITARKQFEARLRASEAKFRNVLETISLIGLVLDQDGRILLCNDFLLRLTGWQRDEILGCNWFDRFLPEDIRLHVKVDIFLYTIRQGELQEHQENEILTRTGERRLVAWSNTVLRDADGEVVGVASIGEDITERRRAEDELRQSEETLRTIIDKAPMAVAITIGAFGGENRVQFVNRRFTQLFGYQLEDMPTVDAWWSLAYPDPAMRARIQRDRQSQIERLIDAGSELEAMESEVTCRDGTVKIVEWNFVPLGERCLVFGLDLTARKQAEYSLQKTSEELSAYFNSALDLFCIADKTGYFRKLSPAWEKTLGYTSDELTGRPFIDLVHPDDRETTRVLVAGLSHGAVVSNFINRYLHRDGTYRWLEWQAEERNGIIYAAARDVTERRDVELELAGYRHHLEELVASRTQALRLAVEEAEQANRAKSVFLSNMSHELRTPLNAVIGFSRLMSKSANLSETERRNLEIINRSGNHLLTLINDVLELSKIESGHVVLQEEDTDLGGLIADVADMLGTRAEQAGLTLALKTEGLPAGVRVDAMKLRQILINLLGNAVKFTRQGGVTLTVHGSSAEAERGQARVRLAFAVSDTGIGIAAEDRQKIFEPFVQMVTHATSAGTGLGLTISRQYLKMLGSDLAVESTPGEGSTFRFEIELPIVAVPAGAAPVKGEVIGLSETERGKKILVAEDNPDARALLRALLEPLGFTVIEAEDGAAAEAEVERQAPDLVIMDWRMPVMDGLEATRRIRGRAELKQPKIVMLTASAFEEQRQEALVAGVDDYLRKPLQENQLFATLQNLLGVSLLKEVVADPAATGAEVELAPAMMAQMPERLRPMIVTAVEELNRGKLNALLEELEATAPDMARGIARMADQYRFRELWDLLTGSR